MRRCVQISKTSRRVAIAAASLSIACAGCPTVSGVAPGDVPHCPQVVLDGAAESDLSDEALSALTTHCESLERIRGGDTDDE